MNNRYWLIGLAATLLLTLTYVAVTLFLQKSPSIQNSNDKLPVQASIRPIADMVDQIGGQFVEVKTILPPGASPHVFEPTPEQIRAAQNIKIIFAIGHGFDDWTKSIIDNASKARVVYVDNNIQIRELPLDQRDEDEPDQSTDPHYWLSVKNAKIISQNIFNTLSQADPNHQNEYKENLDAYLKELDELDAYIKNKFSTLSDNHLITHHNAWGYFAEEYGLEIVGTFEVSPGEEPTPQEIVNLQNTVRRYNIKTIFSEPQLSEASLKPFVRDLKLNTAVLDPEGATNAGYAELMKSNADIIAKSL